MAAEGPTPVEARCGGTSWDGLRRCDPVTGLTTTIPRCWPSTRCCTAHRRWWRGCTGIWSGPRRSLAGALGGGLDARLAAGQIIAVRRILAQEKLAADRGGGAGSRTCGTTRVAAAGRAFGALAETLSRLLD
ncbi:hypothetical protein GCM10023238_24340 [Streptomyces heliomycini]